MKFNKLFKRSLFGDFDGDGVMNAFDCQPKNKKKQDTIDDVRIDLYLKEVDKVMKRNTKRMKQMDEIEERIRKNTITE